MHVLSRSGGSVFVLVLVFVFVSVSVSIVVADAGGGEETFDDEYGDSFGERRFFSGPFRSLAFSECR